MTKILVNGMEKVNENIRQNNRLRETFGFKGNFEGGDMRQTNKYPRQG
jgi:hypothetical protein